jgi:rfaE bifunctional protein kinase chain/domain
MPSQMQGKAEALRTKLLPLDQTSDYQGCVLTYGHFSTIHPGHIRYLRHARSLGRKLVVALAGDGAEPGNPYPFNQQERAEALGLLGLVDVIVLLQLDELSHAIRQLRPTIVVLGTELEDSAKFQEPIAILKSLGGSVQYHAGDVQYASSELLTTPERDLRLQRRIKFQAACKRQGLIYGQLVETMKAWSQTRLIVLGDTIVDQYVACEPIGMSAEAPIVVVRELAKRNFIGAAAVVAAHIRALGAQCDLVSVVGNDTTAELVRKELEARGIGDALTKDPSRPTTFKKRYVVENQKLFRVSRLEQHDLDLTIEAQVISKLEALAPHADGIVVSDFVYGVVTPRVLQAVARLAQHHTLQVFGDLQCSSQIGSITRFKNFSLLCPNERELRIALKNKDSGLETLSQQLLEETYCERLLVKLAAEGFIAYDRDSNRQVRSQAFPALSVNPLDVAGAGDSVLAVMATGLASRQAMMPTAALACCMAALSVDTMGNSPISAETLRSYLGEVLSI